jgi:hypothetical protein
LDPGRKILPLECARCYRSTIEDPTVGEVWEMSTRHADIVDWLKAKTARNLSSYSSEITMMARTFMESEIFEKPLVD